MNLRKVLSAGLIGVVSLMLVLGVGCEGAASPAPTETATAPAPVSATPAETTPAATEVPTPAATTPVPTEGPIPTATATAPTPAAMAPASTEAPSRLWELRNETPLHRAAFDGDAEAMEDLLDQGTDISALASACSYEDYTCLNSVTPLHLAALNNSGPEVATLLLNRGSDVNAEDAGGRIPLHLAAADNPSPFLTALLLDRGADVNAEDDNGWTPLRLAARHNPSPTVAALLLDQGADINADDHAGFTPLHWAARDNPSPAVAALLLDRGADINAKNSFGFTPLHLAAQQNSDPAVVVLLLDRGADINASMDFGSTPCDVAGQHLISTAPHIYDRLCVAPNLPTPAPSPTPRGTPPLGQTSAATDREVLIALFNATDGENWESNDNWLTDQPLGHWHGVGADGGRVWTLELVGNNLSGEIPPELGNLANLRELHLSANRLTGEIPQELGNLPDLGVLGLSFNRLRGEVPSWLGKLPLKFLLLSGNLLDGCAPTSVINELGPNDDTDLQLNGHYCFAGPPQGVGQTLAADASTSAATDRGALVSLYHATNGKFWSRSLNWLSEAPLDQWNGVYTNQDGRVVALHLLGVGLEGEIPPELGDLSFLEELALPYNALRGEIPPELGNLRRLRHLNLFENDIGGEIPPELGRLENLVSLHLSYNDLEGVIPRELGDLANLEILTLQDNNLSGGVPPELGTPSLRHLGLDSDIGGCIPNRLYRQLNLQTSRLGDISPC